MPSPYCKWSVWYGVQWEEPMATWSFSPPHAPGQYTGPSDGSRSCQQKTNHTNVKESQQTDLPAHPFHSMVRRDQHGPRGRLATKSTQGTLRRTCHFPFASHQMCSAICSRFAAARSYQEGPHSCVAISSPSGPACSGHMSD